MKLQVDRLYANNVLINVSVPAIFVIRVLEVIDLYQIVVVILNTMKMVVEIVKVILLIK